MINTKIVHRETTVVNFNKLELYKYKKEVASLFSSTPEEVA
jgi:hypothetical protein